MILCEQSTQTNENFHEEVVISRSPKEDPSQEEIRKEIALLSKDPSYVPSKHDEQSDDSNNQESEEDSKPVNPQNDVKFLVFKEQLDKLLKRCYKKKTYIHPGINCLLQGSVSMAMPTRGIDSP